MCSRCRSVNHQPSGALDASCFCLILVNQLGPLLSCINSQTKVEQRLVASHQPQVRAEVMFGVGSDSSAEALALRRDFRFANIARDVRR